MMATKRNLFVTLLAVVNAAQLSSGKTLPHFTDEVVPTGNREGRVFILPATFGILSFMSGLVIGSKLTRQEVAASHKDVKTITSIHLTQNVPNDVEDFGSMGGVDTTPEGKTEFNRSDNFSDPKAIQRQARSVGPNEEGGGNRNPKQLALLAHLHSLTKNHKLQFIFEKIE